MKNKKIFWMAGLMGMQIILNACYYDEVIPVAKSVGDVGTVTFAVDIIPIFNKSCNTSGCHSQGGQKPNLTPDNAYNSLINGGYVNKATPETSLIYQKMVKAPMPPSGSDATNNAKVLRWIELGAQNN